MKFSSDLKQQSNRSPGFLSIPFFIAISMLVACRFQSQADDVNPHKSDEAGEVVAKINTIVGAHRGGAYAGFPENCLETMQYVKMHVPGVVHEIDIATTRDGALVLMHDPSIDRTTNGTGRIDQHTRLELQRYRLLDQKGVVTPFKIPDLSTVLSWAVSSNTPLMLDIKRSTRYEDVLSAVLAAKADMLCTIITYDVKAAQRVHHLHPDTRISVTIRNEEEWKRFISSGIPFDRVIAFTGTVLSPQALFDTLRSHGIPSILGTLGNLDRQAASRGDRLYRAWAEMGIDMISSDRPIEVQRALYPEK